MGECEVDIERQSEPLVLLGIGKLHIEVGEESPLIDLLIPRGKGCGAIAVGRQHQVDGAAAGGLVVEVD